jgi:hypothetical protein
MSDFFQNLHQEVLQHAGSDDSRALSESFTNWVLEMLREDTISGGEAVHYRSEDGKSGIDAFCLSEDRCHLDVFVSAYYQKRKEICNEEIKKLLDSANEFINRAKNGFHSERQFLDEAVKVASKSIFEAQGSLIEVRVFLLTNAQARDGLRVTSGDNNVAVEIWDISRIAEHGSQKRKVVKLDFENNYGGQVPCVCVEEGAGEYRTFLTFFRGDVLARIYGAYNLKLLEHNVRVSLRDKGATNKGIQKTLAEEPGRFLAYNNGLCCTAAEVEVRNEGGHAFLRSVTDFQIVNGGQTTSSLDIYNRNQKGDPDNLKRVWVQAKITVIHDPDKVDEIVPLISRYANSQNKVSGADFSANGPFHKALQKISLRTKAPSTGGDSGETIWYYERARGAYADERARNAKQKLGSKKIHKISEWEIEHPLKQKLTKTDVAKLEHCWAGNPFYTCLGADKSFRKMAEQFESEEPEVTPSYFKNLVAKAIIWNSIEGQFDLLKLKGCRSQTVAYIFSFLALRSDKRIDLNSIWDQQHCQTGMIQFIKSLCSNFHDTLMSNGGVPSFLGAGAMLSKTEKYWRKFFEIKNDIAIPDAWRSEWAKTPFEVIYKTEDGLAAEWERVRYRFVDDHREMGALANAFQKKWSPSRSSEFVYVWAGKSWTEIMRLAQFGPVKRKELIDLFSAAFQAPE